MWIDRRPGRMANAILAVGGAVVMSLLGAACAGAIWWFELEPRDAARWSGFVFVAGLAAFGLAFDRGSILGMVLAAVVMLTFNPATYFYVPMDVMAPLGLGVGVGLPVLTVALLLCQQRLLYRDPLSGN